MLGPKHTKLIGTLFNINWTIRSAEITNAFKNFVEELMCRHLYHSKLVFDELVKQFRSSKIQALLCFRKTYFSNLCIFISVDQGATEWENGVCPDEHKLKISHIHDLLQKFLKIIPM